MTKWAELLLVEYTFKEQGEEKINSNWPAIGPASHKRSWHSQVAPRQWFLLPGGSCARFRAERTHDHKCGERPAFGGPGGTAWRGTVERRQTTGHAALQGGARLPVGDRDHRSEYFFSPHRSEWQRTGSDGSLAGQEEDESGSDLQPYRGGVEGSSPQAQEEPRQTADAGGGGPCHHQCGGRQRAFD